MKGTQEVDIHELTRVEAFLLSEKAGHPSHMSDHFWSQAESIVRQRIAIVNVAVHAADDAPKPAPKKRRSSPASATPATPANKTTLTASKKAPAKKAVPAATMDALLPLGEAADAAKPEAKPAAPKKTAAKPTAAARKKPASKGAA